jgi:hypothetical protein
LVLPAVIALGALLANAAVLAARTYPAWRERAAAQAGRDAADSELHAVRQQIRTLETMGRGVLAAGEGLEVLLGQRLTGIAGLPEVLQHVRDTASAAGVRLERIDHAVEPVASLGAVRWQMATLGAGSYGAVRAWLAALREGPGLLYVDRLEIGGSGDALLAVEVTLVVLLRTEASVIP